MVACHWTAVCENDMRVLSTAAGRPFVLPVSLGSAAIGDAARTSQTSAYASRRSSASWGRAVYGGRHEHGSRYFKLIRSTHTSPQLDPAALGQWLTSGYLSGSAW